ncbi:hypothetical protein WN55_03783 [Dufourea novaeangliae]|uniref:Uncharacterized protein n=1 Tax=Dufourea novaeangliae TaxID=178035 RepID=A0A154PK79_DUFNO|nr:hypothetical protein WN55_03783 [Dufourea novaeangliae]
MSNVRDVKLRVVVGLDDRVVVAEPNVVGTGYVEYNIVDTGPVEHGNVHLVAIEDKISPVEKCVGETLEHSYHKQVAYEFVAVITGFCNHSDGSIRILLLPFDNRYANFRESSLPERKEEDMTFFSPRRYSGKAAIKEIMVSVCSVLDYVTEIVELNSSTSERIESNHIRIKRHESDSFRIKKVASKQTRTQKHSSQVEKLESNPFRIEGLKSNLVLGRHPRTPGSKTEDLIDPKDPGMDTLRPKGPRWGTPRTHGPKLGHLGLGPSLQTSESGGSLTWALGSRVFKLRSLGSGDVQFLSL